VDYDLRRTRLAELDAGGSPRDLDDEKLLVVSRALRLRREHPDWFGPAGTYAPLDCGTPHALAFVRAGSAVTVAARLTVRGEGWGDAAVALPDGRWHDLLTGTAYDGRCPVGDLLAELPVALLVRAAP
jgi:(1->4)-alpha-D-glucan 1-alpha-D-glucosylmutase